MPKKWDESFIDYRKRTIDPISSSFCAAKWLNATIWLDKGKTTSCHHPPYHNVDASEIGKNPSALHNTQHKKKMRQMMLQGKRPPECEYCWKIEDMGRDSVSDRVFKTEIYQDDSIFKLGRLDWQDDIDLQTLEISFSRVCNFACCYCNDSFSTTWSRDIKDNGPYQNLRSHDSHTYKRDGSKIHHLPQPAKWKQGISAFHNWIQGRGFVPEEENPYTDAFWKWWPKLSKSLFELRVTGGEPLLSADLWRLLEYFKNNKVEHIRLAVNSNLGARDMFIDRLIKASHHLKHFEIYTSNEAYGLQAEYIRDGLDYQRWKHNILRLRREGNLKAVHVMMTINALCLFSITKLFDDILSWRQEFNDRNLGIWTLNLLRFPAFMSPLILPDHIKEERRAHLQSWMDNQKGNALMHEMEFDSIHRLIDYLDIVKDPHRKSDSRNKQLHDFKSFFAQYDKRRGKELRETFPQELSQWLEQI